MRSTTGTRTSVTSRRRAADASVRTSLAPSAIAAALIDNLRCLQARLPQHATRHDWYMALAYTVRDRLLDRCATTVEAVTESVDPTSLFDIQVERLHEYQFAAAGER